MDIKGVNLGNWLVLEKWMNPAMFEGTDAKDEYYLPTQLSPEVYQERIRMHRREYISERDFARIKAMELNAVRIPVPYFIFGDRPPFIGCIEELDHAFDWAKKYDIYVLIDLHTAPDSQNGMDNGGIYGVCKWSQQIAEVEFQLSVLERLAKRYGKRSNLWGIEVLNEPITEKTWQLMDIPKMFPAYDQEKAKGSQPNSFEFICDFYEKAYKIIRKYVPKDKYIIFHDAFDLNQWKEFILENNFENIALDTHQYLMIGEAMGYQADLLGYHKFISEIKQTISKVQEYVPVICGEWSLYNSFSKKLLKELKYEDDQVKSVYHELKELQLDAWKQCLGQFYWSYKNLIDTTHNTSNNKKSIGWDCWDLSKCIDLNWF